MATDYSIATHWLNGGMSSARFQPKMLLQHSITTSMKKFPAVYSRMIAAYVIGYPVTADFMAVNKHLKFAKGPDETGVIISYNTQSPKVVQGTNIVVGNNVGLAINPINWKRDETLASASESLGSLWFGANHSFDIPFYYYNLRENAERRASKFLNK